MNRPTPTEIANLISEDIDLVSEETVSISDNEISSLIHHLEDTIKGLKSGQNQVVRSSLGDIREIAMELLKKLPPEEQREAV